MVENKNVHTENACGYDDMRVGVAVFPQCCCNGTPDENLWRIVSMEFAAVESVAG